MPKSERTNNLYNKLHVLLALLKEPQDRFPVWFLW